MGLGGMLVWLASCKVKVCRRFRKEALFLFLLVLLGPGLFVNGIFKAHYGRPRPNQCEVFGGEKAYQPVLEYIRHETGQRFRSFPCGHASIGFAVMGPYFFLRYRSRRKARQFMLLGIFLGIWAGLSRMVEGRHFASDVFWAGAMVYFVGLLLAGCFRFNRDREPAPAATVEVWDGE
jgi:membrane-associated PAP2 superfamily phosphatase